MGRLFFNTQTTDFTEILIDWSEIFDTRQNFAAVKRQENTKSHRPANVRVKINRLNRENDDVYLIYIETFGMYVVKILFYFMKPADYTYYTYFLIF